MELVSAQWRPARQAAVLLLLGLLARAPLIVLYPAVPNGDALARLFHADRVLLAYQLPLPQLLVHWGTGLGLTVAGQRLLAALIGAAAAVALHALFRALLEPAAAWVAGLIFALNPLFLFYSTYPYQEPLMLLGLSLAATCHWRGSPLAPWWLAIACLARFEAWIAALLMAADSILRRRAAPPPAAWRAAAYLAIPLGWILIRGGLAPAGTYVVDTDVALAKLARLGQLAAITAGAATLPVAITAVIGVPRALELLRASAELRALAVFGLTFLVLVIPFGHSYPLGSSRLVDREAHLPLAGVALLAGIGATRLWEWSAHGRGRRIVVAALAALGAGSVFDRTVRYYHERCATPEILRVMSLARRLEASADTGPVAVFAPPPPAEPVRRYLEIMRARGPAELAAARAMVDDYGRPPWFQMLAVLAPHAAGRLLSADRPLAGTIESVGLVAILHPYAPNTEVERTLLARLRPRLRLRQRVVIGGEAAELYQALPAGAAGEIPPASFVEIAAPAGLAFAGRSEGVAWGDFDRDDDFDLLVAVDGGRARLYRNQTRAGGPPSFSEVSAELGLSWSGRAFGGAWSDVDLDGDLDLALAAWPRPLFYRNDGARFTEIGSELGLTAPTQSQSVLWRDLDADGREELLLTGLDGTRLYRLTTRGLEDLTRAWGLDPELSTVGAAYLGTRTGAGNWLALAGRDRSRIVLLRQELGHPERVSAVEVPLADPPAGMAVGACGIELERHRPTFYLARFRRGNQWLGLVRGASHFEDLAAGAGLAAARTSIGCAWADTDLDGDLDLFVANENLDALYINEGGRVPRLRESALWAGLADPAENVGCAFADADGDGDLDLMVANYAGPDRFHLNRSKGRSLRIRPLKRGGAPAVGARVRVTFAEGSSVIQEVDGGGGFGSQNAAELIFGLGDHVRVQVRVDFPAGASLELSGAAGQSLRLVEPAEPRP